MENQIIETLPAEVAEIAKNVSLEKRTEVQTVLNQVFNGVSKMREQLDGIEIQDENDKTNMKLANTIRLGVREVRLEAEKTFDKKRTEVQAQMLSYKTEDQLWLKAKQTMQILTKEIEETARWKEQTKERFDLEQKELKTEQRFLKVSKFSSGVLKSELSNMSDESFSIFLSGIEKQYNDKIEADRIEAEELEKARIQKEADDAKFKIEQEEKLKLQAEENARLKAEAEEKERQRLEAEKKRKALEEKAKADKAKADAKLKAEQDERARLEAELKAKNDAELKAKKEADEIAAAELKAKLLAEKKAKSAPDKVKLEALAKSIESIGVPEVKSEEAEKILEDTKLLLEKVANYIRQKIDLI